MNFILVIWTIVGAVGIDGRGERGVNVQYGWRPIGGFEHVAACELGAATLGITDKKNFRCLKTN